MQSYLGPTDYNGIHAWANMLLSTQSYAWIGGQERGKGGEDKEQELYNQELPRLPCSSVMVLQKIEMVEVVDLWQMVIHWQLWFKATGHSCNIFPC